jgi:hypothetical protein
MSHRKSDLGIPCTQKICQSSASHPGQDSFRASRLQPRTRSSDKWMMSWLLQRYCYPLAPLPRLGLASEAELLRDHHAPSGCPTRASCALAAASAKQAEKITARLPDVCFALRCGRCPKACVKFWMPIDTLAASGLKFRWRSVHLVKDKDRAHGVWCRHGCSL